jgi:hypothetical protein
MWSRFSSVGATNLFLVAQLDTLFKLFGDNGSANIVDQLLYTYINGGRVLVTAVERSARTRVLAVNQTHLPVLSILYTFFKLFGLYRFVDQRLYNNL